ncbi:MAG: NAD(P)H-binding protein, partial [Actinobacteria bacterium]|nr:NAD(P)H-binding protein [Actinomycetota bacterium]
MRCVVFGATGYIGGRLVPALLAAGHQVRAVARTPGKLAEVPWRDRAEIINGDVTDPTSVRDAMSGQDVAYFLVHSLNRRDFVDVDRRAAHVLAEAARTAGLTRLVYLGGITPDVQHLSDHLASRAEVGQILLDSGVPTIVLQAAVILGSGSASFEMLRYLTERLPAMVTPRWVHNRVQPIAVRDVLHYLTHAAELPPQVHRAFDIGGPNVLTYLEMMRRYAVVAGLPCRVVLPVPMLTPWLSAQWVNLVTPVPRSIAIPLIESLVHEVVCHDQDIA